jgi:AbiTii
MARRDLPARIERGAHDPRSDLSSVLRLCISLGGVTGSDSLREWSSRELMGYGSDDELPDYRKAAAPLVLDAHVPGGRITGQQVPYTLIPDFAQDDLGDDIEFRQPIAEIAEMLASARRRGETTVKLGVPLGSGVVALMNDEFRRGSRPQVIERIHWDVSLVPLTRILDAIRTRLVALIAEMRAGTPAGKTVPSREVAERAVGVVIHGKGHRIVIQQDSPGATATVGEGESRARRIAFWIVVVATVVAAIAAILVLL